MNEKTFTIKVTMNERWIDDFCSMLKRMEYCGKVGHSSILSFYSDGDGDFRPKFEIDTDFNKTEPRQKELPSNTLYNLYDAG